MKQFESFRLDTSNLCLWRDGVQIALPPKPFAVLRYLVENPGRLITHDELLDALWPETFVQPQVLRTYMLDLRKLLDDDAREPRFIRTIPKRGYRFVAQVTERPDTPAHPAASIGAALARPPGIVDRTVELTRITALLELAAASQRQVVFVTGETGIGKTAFVDAFCAQASAAIPLMIARGQCVLGFGAKEQHYPVMEALAHLCASPHGELACRILEQFAPAWLAPLGRSHSNFGDASPHSAHGDRTLTDLCAALEQLAAENVLLLVFEDLQWADDSTIDLISALARRRGSARLMLLATSRAHDASSQRLKELHQDLLVRRLCAEIALAPLTKPAMKELLRRELKQDELPPGLADFVHQRSEGNPLFAIAIVEHLIAQRFLERHQDGAASRWVQRLPFHEIEAGVPDELARMVELEVARLDPHEQRILEAGSLNAIAFPAWQVAAALDEDPAAIEEACDSLARRLYFVHRAGQDELPDGTRSAFYVFAHDLYREVLYRRQPEARRAARHIRIAGRMGELFAGRAALVAREMATHYELAGSWQQAVAALRSAASHALERHARAEARELLEHALRIAQNLFAAERTAVEHQLRAELAPLREEAMQPSSLL
jgi:DNA-binding winged helix-turn-helix (wHTH) protein